MPLRPCLDCGVPTAGTRCPLHSAQKERARTQAKRVVRPERSWAERQRRKNAVDAHRAQYGDWCPGYRVPPHPDSDLTADHVISYAASGTEDGPLEVLCRACNGRKADVF